MTEQWTEQQERLLRAAQDVVNDAESRGSGLGECILVGLDEFGSLKAVVQEIHDDAVKIIEVGYGQGDYYWINKPAGNYRCNICGFQYHDADPIAHMNLKHGRAPVTEGKGR